MAFHAWRCRAWRSPGAFPMNVVLFRELSLSQLEGLQREFSGITFRQVSKPEDFVTMLDWPAVVFGNIPAPLAARAANLRWIQIVSSGIDEYKILAGSRIVVSTANGLHAAIVARHTLMMVLMLE